MSRPLEPLSAAQIHSVYAPKVKHRGEAINELLSAPNYSKASFSGRVEGHPGSPPPLPESKSKKRRI